MVLGYYSGLMGVVESIFIRSELASPMPWINSGHLYNVIVTRHAFIIIFFMVMPTLIGGFGNWILPKLVGLKDLIFPRMNAASF